MKRVSASSVAVQESVAQKRTTSPARGMSTAGASVQSLAMSAMVALGFWGLALFCAFFYVTDPNHYLYGAIMGLTAIGWSVIVVRRWLAYRPRL